MSDSLDLQALVERIGPHFAEGATERDAGDVFVADNYDVLRRHKVFSALVPTELARETIAAEHVLAAVEKALEVAGGAGFYRGLGLERLLRDAHGAQLHPLSAKRQHRFAGRVALGLDPIADVT